MRKMFKKIFGKTEPKTASPEALQALNTAETKLIEANTMLRKATKVANTLQTQRETNHFRERYILALKGTPKP